MTENSVSIVIPVYNGERYLDEMVQRIEAVMGIFSQYEILFVDDGSPDRSYEKIKSLSAVKPSVKGYLLDGNFGQQNAILCGLANSTGDYIVIMDDDLENPPEAIPVLYREISKGFDAVYALDARRGGKGFVRITGSFLRDITFRFLTRLPRGMKVCSFRMMTAELSKKVAAAESPFVYISMEMLKFTSNVSNIKVEYGSRRESGHSFTKLVRLLFRIYVYYSGSVFMKKFRKTGPSYILKESTGGNKE